jgi:dTDP-glucose pyrophosphorylase
MSIKDALKVMDSNGYQIVLVTDVTGFLLGLVTDGDMRRTIMRSVSLNDCVDTIMNRDFSFVTVGTDRECIKEIFSTKRINHLAVLNSDGIVCGMLLRGDVAFRGEKVCSSLDNMVVVMAGGKGSRLDPLTKILPKPMIPLGEKPVLEHIMERFHAQGFSNFVLSVNYKKEIIKLYFNELIGKNYQVSFIEENQPLGTAGSLSLLTDEIIDTVVVTNCDIIIETDYRDILKFHHSHGNDLTIVGSLKHIKVPYGVINLKNSIFECIEEKPEYDVLINTGLYYLEPGLLSLIPNEQVFDMPDLILKAQLQGKKIGVYPIYNCWHDVGQWDEYRKTLVALGCHD